MFEVANSDVSATSSPKFPVWVCGPPVLAQRDPQDRAFFCRRFGGARGGQRTTNIGDAGTPVVVFHFFAGPPRRLQQASAGETNTS
jgi:hypothetical protein